MNRKNFAIFISIFIILLQSLTIFTAYGENGEGFEGYAEIISMESPCVVGLSGNLTTSGTFQHSLSELTAVAISLCETGSSDPLASALDSEEFLVNGEGVQPFTLSATAPHSEQQWNLTTMLWVAGITDWILIDEYNFTVTVTSATPEVEITSLTLSNYEPDDGDEVTIITELIFTGYTIQDEASVKFIVDGTTVHEEAVTVPPTETHICDLSFEWTAVEGTHTIAVEVLDETKNIDVSVGAMEPMPPSPSATQIDPIWIMGGAAVIGVIAVGAYLFQRGKQKPKEPSAVDRWLKEGPDEKQAAEWALRKEGQRRLLKKMYKESGMKVKCRTSFEWMFHKIDLKIYPTTGETRIPEDRPLPMMAAAYDKHVLIQKCDCLCEELDDMSTKNHILHAMVHRRWLIIEGKGGFIDCEGDDPKPLIDGEQILYQPPFINDENEKKKVKIKVTARHFDGRNPPRHDPCVITFEMEIRKEKNEYVYKTKILSKKCPETNPLPPEKEGDCIPSYEWKPGSPISLADILTDEEVMCGDLCQLSAYASDWDELVLRCTPVDPTESRVTQVCEIPSEQTLQLGDLLLYRWECDKGRFPFGPGGSNIENSGRHIIWQAPNEEGKVKIKVTIFDRMVHDEQYDDRENIELETEVNVRGKRPKEVRITIGDKKPKSSKPSSTSNLRLGPGLGGKGEKTSSEKKDDEESWKKFISEYMKQIPSPSKRSRRTDENDISPVKVMDKSEPQLLPPKKKKEKTKKKE